MLIKVVVAGSSCSGPEFFGCRVDCEKPAYENGDHYEEAIGLAKEAGYDGPFVAFDEFDGPNWLFDQVFKQGD